jgi:hypothetical protein
MTVIIFTINYRECGVAQMVTRQAGPSSNL